MTVTPFTASRLADAARRDDFMPRRPKGMSKGALMALAAHAVLVIALAFGVRWRASEPTVLSAELWSPVPQSAAPAPPPPVVAPPPAAPPVSATPKPAPPPPTQAERPNRDAEIAVQREAERKQTLKVEQDRQQRELARKELERKEVERKDLARKEIDRKALERKQAEAQKLLEAQEAKRQAQEDETRLTKQRDDQLKRMQSMVGATGAPSATGAAAREAAPSAEYGGRIKARIKPNIVFTDDITGNPMAEVEVRVAPTGSITGRRLTRSSGNKAWDDAVLRAIDRTNTLPRDVDGRVPPAILIEFRPNE